MYTLFSFYRSREWAAFLSALKQERTTDNGEIICDYCGKPIVKAYDMIGHHTEELTEENVNDFTISLNPEKIQLVHHRCHNYIHHKLEYKSREVYLVYGAPLSGKTTWTRESMDEGDLILDMDNIWECISGQARYQKPKRLNAVAFKIRDTILDAIQYRLGRWRCAYIVGGYPLESERSQICRLTGAKEIYIDTDKATCLERLQGSDRPAEEWTRYIEEWFDRHDRTAGTPPITP